MALSQENAQILYKKSTDLIFDKENPRLVEFRAMDYSEERLINLLWKEMAVDELVMSILAYGFFEHEPLYVMATQNDKFTVLEGNRRLAAVRSILNPGIVSGGKMDKFVHQITDEIKVSLETHIPVIVLKNRQNAWQLLGFKHVNGPAKWGSYAKAKYIAQVHNDFGISLDKIAEQIGDTNKTVRKLYQGLMVLEQAMNQAEFSLDDIRTPRLFFSHLYTAIGYEKFRHAACLYRNRQRQNFCRPWTCATGHWPWSQSHHDLFHERRRYLRGSPGFSFPSQLYPETDGAGQFCKLSQPGSH